MSTDDRLARLARDITIRYGIETSVSGHTRITLCGTGSIQQLEEWVWDDPQLDALGRGWYLGAFGEFELVEMPAWTFEPASVALARIAAVYLKLFRIKRVVRFLARALERANRVTGV